MADDLRVPLDPIFEALGVPAVVTRPAPDDVPIETTVVWVSPLTLEVPAGTELRRREQRHLGSFMRAEVPTLPRGTVVVAAEVKGGTELAWQVDAILQVDADEYRALLISIEVGS